MADSPQPPQPQDGSPKGDTPPRWGRWIVWAALLAILAVIILPSLVNQDRSEEIPYRQFMSMLEGQKTRSEENPDGATALPTDIARVQINNTTGDIVGWRVNETSFRSIGPTELPQTDYDLISQAIGEEVEFTRPTSSIWATMIPMLLPVGLLILFFWWMQRRAQGQMSGIMSIGRSRARTYSTERPATTFDDVAGYENTKQEIREVVDFLKEPEKFARIGARIPKGILLVGPPGTGKTLIARAVAGEAGVPFLSVTGSDFMEMFVGVGASRVRDLFQSARKMGRAIIFIDEIDSIGRKRGAGLGGGHDEREQTLNQMLSEMDGFEATEGIVMMAATNRPDILDPALLRPGRFDRQVVVPLPELDDRQEILKVHVKGKALEENTDLSVLARGTPGMSGADLANLVNEAALGAVREGYEAISSVHFEQARDRVLIGQQRESMVLTEDEKKAVAYHEAGHAVCAASLVNADPLHKVSIIPSGVALGVTMQLPEHERHIYQQSYIEDTLAVRMGGRVAEDLVFGVVSTGANDDLVGATQMAKKMVREWGMSERLGPMAWGSHSEVFLGEEIVSTREYSDETARLIDEEVERILREQENRCRLLLKERRLALDLVANALLERESIPGSEVERLLGLAMGNGSGPDSITAEQNELAAASALAASVRPS